MNVNDDFINHISNTMLEDSKEEKRNGVEVATPRCCIVAVDEEERPVLAPIIGLEQFFSSRNGKRFGFPQVIRLSCSKIKEKGCTPIAVISVADMRFLFYQGPRGEKMLLDDPKMHSMTTHSSDGIMKRIDKIDSIMAYIYPYEAQSDGIIFDEVSYVVSEDYLRHVDLPPKLFPSDL